MFEPSFTPDAARDNQAPDYRCEPPPCVRSCENVFSRVHVSYLIRGGTSVTWTLVRTFADPQPWTFQLETGRTGNMNADDWTAVGAPVVDTCYAVDTVRRSYGAGLQDTHYRIRLTTANGIYYSLPTAKEGVLNSRDWRLAGDILRRERLRSRYAASDGFLLKRRITGQDCTRCLDPQTRDVMDAYCPVCRGTGKVCGYYMPIPCVWADIEPLQQQRQLDDQLTAGTERTSLTRARMSMFPIVEEQDVWVNRKTDDRYLVASVSVAAAFRTVPLIANVMLRLVPFTDVIYDIEIPNQLMTPSPTHWAAEE